MRINADFSRPALVRAAGAEWQASPEPGVERLMLDRIGGEVARATSLVRYAPGSRFGSHTHHRGEEFLVLEGIFSDALGDYGPGAYVRNPPGSAHAPWSDVGCTIFVKLRQFDNHDRKRVVIDTASAPHWAPLDGGAERLELHRFGPETVALYRLDAEGTVGLDGGGGLEALVLDGTVTVADTRLDPRDWLRLPPGGTVLLCAGAGGARIYVRTGHLAAAKNEINSTP